MALLRAVAQARSEIVELEVIQRKARRLLQQPVRVVPAERVLGRGGAAVTAVTAVTSWGEVARL